MSPEIPKTDMRAMVDSTALAKAALVAEVLTNEHVDTVEEPELVTGIDGWITNKQLAIELEIDKGTCDRIAKAILEEIPDEMQTFMHPKLGRPVAHYSPILRARIRQVAHRHPLPLDGWVTINDIKDESGWDEGAIRFALEKMRSDNPEKFQMCRMKMGRPALHIDSDLAKSVVAELNSIPKSPEGWYTVKELARQGATSESVVHGVLRRAEIDPSWQTLYRDKSHRAYTHYNNEVLALVKQRARVVENAVPSTWIPKKDLIEILGMTMSDAYQKANEVKDERPDLFCFGKGQRGQLLEFISPEVVDHLKEGRVLADKPPEGWMTVNGVAQKHGLGHDTIAKYIDRIRDIDPYAIHLYRTQSGASDHFSPEAVLLIEQDITSRFVTKPEGEEWIHFSAMASELHRSDSYTRVAIEALRESYPNQFRTFVSGRGKPTEHIGPVVADILRREHINSNSRLNRKAEQALQDELEAFLSEIGEGTSESAQEFRTLTGLFGAEYTVDILTQLHPEYGKMPMPKVKGIIADYLGDFLKIRGNLQIEDVKAVGSLLTNPALQEGFKRVVLEECLKTYNNAQTSSEHIDISSILKYISSLRLKTKDLDNIDLNKTFDEVEAYHQAIASFVKPNHVIDNLDGERLFPDLNQLVNIKELADKHKMLIADEMGTGKSASVIMAKEYLQLKQALVVAPSNVLHVWESYLSSRSGEDGGVKGYFKAGQEPRVLIIDDLSSLDKVVSEYDYVLVSQEKLNETYTTSLEKLDFDMLIVDESHKLKNLVDGKRSENLLRLANKIEGENKYLALLSGTPVPNKLTDVAVILKLLYPEQFAEVKNQELSKRILDGNLLDLRSLLLPRMQMKSLHESIELPELTEITETVTLSNVETAVYEALVEEDELSATQKLHLLRQFVLNPSLIELTPESGGSKTSLISERLRETFATKDRVVLFTNNYVNGVTQGDQSIVDQLNLPTDIKVLTIDGDVSKAKRVLIEAELRSSGQKILAVVSGQTADVGVDFSGAQEVFFYNEPWTKYEKQQQLARVYRPGLADDLISRTFITEGTIEEGIHEHIEAKYDAVEKLLRGVPLTELEANYVRIGEQLDGGDEVNPDLARFYFSSWNKMMKIYAHVKEIGEENFSAFLEQYGKEYAECYENLGRRSYQANAARLSSALIDNAIKEKGQITSDIHILDIASGPEMLKKHTSRELADSIVSVDINAEHFSQPGTNRIVGSFTHIPIASASMDYANLSLALHYTSYLPGKGNYERLQIFRELNRILKVGGRGYVNLIYTQDFRNSEAIHEVVEKSGFKLVENTSGTVSSGNSFHTRMVTVEKVESAPESSGELATKLSSKALNSIKLVRASSKLRDTRKVVTNFVLNGTTQITVNLNEKDQKVLDEEQFVTAHMDLLKKTYQDVKSIPTEKLTANGFARFFNGKSYVLFKQLASAPGIVIYR